MEALKFKLLQAGIRVTADNKIQRKDLEKAIEVLAAKPFKMPKLKLNTNDSQKIGLIEIDGKRYTEDQLEKMKEIIINRDLDLSSRDLKEFPKWVAKCEIGGNFNCSYNSLTSLQGAPKEVGGDFNCSDNGLTSLEGAPEKVGKGFYCPENELTSLEGAPKEVGGDFICSGNKLTSLQGAPKKVGGGFYCSLNKLISLEGVPSLVIGDFICSYNKLTSLQGAPKVIGGSFNCCNNKLTSLEDAPEEVGKHFWGENNSVLFDEIDVKKVCDVVGDITV